MNLIPVIIVMIGSAALVLLGAPELFAMAGVVKFFNMPIQGMKPNMVTQRFSASHNGIDIGVPIGTPVLAVAPCVVVNVIDTPSAAGGKQIVMRGRLPFLPVVGFGYAHLSRIDVVKGQEVEAGAVIGLSGNTGKTRGRGDATEILNRTDGRGAHLHFTALDVLRRFDAVDPAPFLPESIDEGSV